MERTLQAVRKSEQKLNQQCKEQVDEFSAKQDKLQEVQDEYNSKSQGLNELQNTLSQVSDELSGVKGRMDERGQNMTDTSPLIKIKSALQRIKEERKQMDVRIGVVTHTLVAKKLKADLYTKKEAAMPKNAHVQRDTTDDYDLERPQ